MGLPSNSPQHIVHIGHWYRSLINKSRPFIIYSKFDDSKEIIVRASYNKDSRYGLLIVMSHISWGDAGPRRGVDCDVPHWLGRRTNHHL